MGSRRRTRSSASNGVTWPRGLHNLGLGGSALVDPFTAQVMHPLSDALHPDSATHRLIGERFAKYAFAGEGPFAQRG